MNGERAYGLAKAAYRGVTGEYATRASRTLTQFKRFAKSEVSTWRSPVSMSLRRRLWLWRHGFLSSADVLYDLEKDNYRRYLSSYQRERAAWLNGERSTAFDNKLFFHWMTEPFDDQRVATYGLLRDGRFHDLHTLRSDEADTGSHGTADAAAWVDERLREDGALVLKPVTGGGGKDVRLCSYSDGTYRVNGDEHSAEAFRELVAGLDEYLVTERVEQAAYADDLYPDAANTLRVLTIYDEEADEPYLAGVVHRIGTERSAPLDNLVRGGLVADVDRDTGELGEAVRYLGAEQLVRYANHPDTGTAIAGTTVPGWPAVREQLLEMAATFSHAPYIGWDVIVTDEGEFTVIEGNNCSGVRVFQVHEPLLDDSRVRRFYERHGIVPAE
ncbi:sugar-transfer associated ATP-grasp domain-containing protein [Halococcus sp. AFM35]|uniref:sugar-transfer associated ATP-grasp domain-containing protein n=1 Tax=Halococcus sp. AFM35 TaxID=3421653 RepID=UPI003EBB667E